MESTYYDLGKEGAFTRRQLLKNYPARRVDEFLSSQPAYTLHKQARRNFKQRKTFSKGSNDLFQADLCDVSNLSKWNDNVKFLLTNICVFSKRARVAPLINKSANNVTSAFEKEILNDGNVPVFLQTIKERSLSILNSRTC